MEPAIHRFNELFAQLGLPKDPAAIREFLAAHTPLPNGVSLPDAPFWSLSQTSFLREALLQNADWAELTDQLSEAFRSQESQEPP